MWGHKAVARRWVHPRASSSVVVCVPRRPGIFHASGLGRAGLSTTPPPDEVRHVHGDQPLQVAHEGREALPVALAIGLALGVGQTHSTAAARASCSRSLWSRCRSAACGCRSSVVLVPAAPARQIRKRGVLIAGTAPKLHLEAGLRGLLQGIGDDGAGPLFSLRVEQRCSLLELLRRGDAAWGAPRAPAGSGLTTVQGHGLARDEMAASAALAGRRGARPPQPGWQRDGGLQGVPARKVVGATTRGRAKTVCHSTRLRKRCRSAPGAPRRGCPVRLGELAVARHGQQRTHGAVSIPQAGRLGGTAGRKTFTRGIS